MREEVDLIGCCADRDQQTIDGSCLCVSEQSKDQQGERGRHDEVRHIDDRLEDACALQIKTLVCEPVSKQKRYSELRDKAHQPHDDGIVYQCSYRNALCACKEIDVVLQTYEIRTNLVKTGHVLLEEAVINCCDQGPQLEYCVYDKERRNKEIAPLRIAYRLAFHSFITITFILFPASSTSEAAQRT